MSEKVLILGGGPTGLATAVRVAKAGTPVKVIERLPWTGGLGKSFKHGPYTLDLGPHRFTPHSQEVNDFVAKELGINLAVVPYKAEIWLGDRFIGYPFKLGELLKLPPSLSVKLISTYLLSFLKPSSQSEVTYEEWVMNHFGSEVTRLIFRPLIEKVWATPLEGLASRFARQRIAIASLWEIAWEVLTGRRPAKFRSPFYPDNCFLYPVNGFGEIVDRMTEEIQKAHGEVEVGATVKEIHINGGRVTKVVYEKEGEVTSEDNPGFVMSTIPIQYFFDIVKPAPPAEVVAAAKKLRTRRLILLYLVIKKDRYSKNTSIYYPPAEFPYGRGWEQKNHSEKNIDVPGKTVLGLEIPCWETDDVWTMDDKALFERAVRPLEKYGQINRADIEEYFTVKLGSVYPVWDVEFEKNLGVLLEYEKKIENLIFNGRPGLFFYNNLHHSLDMGFVAARHILSGKLKHDKWDIDAKAFNAFQLVE